MSSAPCKELLSPSPAMRSFLEDLKLRTQIDCIQIQCDNARRPAFCRHENCCCGSRISRKNNSMPDMKSRASRKHGNKLDSSGHPSSKSKSRLRRPTSMPNIRAKKDHMISRWTGGDCDTRPVLNSYWSDDLSSCGTLSPKSPTCLRREIQEFPSHAGYRIPLHHHHLGQHCGGGLPNYAMALDFVRQKYATDPTMTAMMLRGGDNDGKLSSSHRPQKRGRPLVKECAEESLLLIPPVRRKSIEDDDSTGDGEGCYEDGLAPISREHFSLKVVLLD